MEDSPEIEEEPGDLNEMPEANAAVDMDAEVEEWTKGKERVTAPNVGTASAREQLVDVLTQCLAERLRIDLSGGTVPTERLKPLNAAQVGEGSSGPTPQMQTAAKFAEVPGATSVAKPAAVKEPRYGLTKSGWELYELASL